MSTDGVHSSLLLDAASSDHGIRRVRQAMGRVADLWPQGLGAVPGSHEPAMKQDADVLRELAAFWLDAQAAALVEYVNTLPDGVSTEALAGAANLRHEAEKLRV